MRNLTLLIPGLFGPKASFSTDYIPQVDSLEFILGRAQRRTLLEESYYRQAGTLLNLATDPRQDIPAAAITRLLDDHEPPQGYWLRVDPVHLSPDRDGLILIDTSAFELNQHDSLAVAAEVRQVLQVYGWNLEAPHPNRWYIKFDKKPDINTTDIASVVGQDINHYLPTGNDAKGFLQIMNEIQMQLHDSDINRERQARGEVPVNSIWFWGLGELPGVLERSWSAVYADDNFIKGLAMLSGTPCWPVPQQIASILDNHPENAELLVVSDHCHVFSQYQDLENWYHTLLKLDENWFVHILEAIKTGALDEIFIVTDGIEFKSDRLILKKFWRRPKPLEFFIEAY